MLKSTALKNLLRFLKVLAIHGSIAVVVLFLIILGVLYAIDSYTNHGEALSVPDFTGMSMKEVEQTCKKHHLRYEVIDSVYSNTAEKGTVVDQSPGVDFKVKENRRIFLTVNATCAERVNMPKVVGVSLRQATALLETYGLKIGNLEYVPDFATNYVLEQKYKGNQLEPGEMVEK
ncbi:MAG: penicillin-binding protein [Marinilabiliales bacterium]|nr:MAG: penicillin-binding protein [Marinilabiliales bacterium]